MSNPAYVKSVPGQWEEEGIRVADTGEMYSFDNETNDKINLILEAMDWPQLVGFNYDGTDRIVAPFVIGVSSGENPLIRGYQLAGDSRSGKGPGWRVFQIRKMLNLVNQGDFFYPDQYGFSEYYPWIYKVFKTLLGS